MDIYPDTFAFVQIHHGDSYATLWGNARADFYTDFGGYPTSYFDGTIRRGGSSSYMVYWNDYLARRAVPTDVTIKLVGDWLGMWTYRVQAAVCLEPEGIGKNLRIYMVHVLDYWPIPPDYSRNGFKQAASTQDIALSPGQCQTIERDFTFDATSWANREDIKIIAWAQEPQDTSPLSNRAEVFQAAIMTWPFVIVDCNGNGVPDDQDISGGTSQDCNGNLVPDECDVADGTSEDCNGDVVPDECQLDGNDCNANGVPDDCEPDCNGNSVPDDCDVAEGTSPDCNGDIVPDECQISGNDCNANLIPDECDSPDCNGNAVPDNCEIAVDPGLDLNFNGVPDSCEVEPRLECGVVAVGDSAVTVTLENSYDSPIVVCSVQYDNNTLPVVSRVSNVTASSFDVRLQNPCGDPVTTDNVSYLVIEEGVSTIDGVEFEAWTYTSTVVDLNLSWVGELRRYHRSHVNPVVLGQVMSENDSDWSVFWCQGATAGDPPSPTLLRIGKHVGSDLDVTRAPETIGVVVIEAGHSTIGGVEFEARVGDATVQGVDNTPPYPYPFDIGFASAPTVAILSQAGMIGADGSWAQAYGPTLATAAALNLSLDEDQLGDTERRHTAERVAYAAFEAPLVYPSVGDGDFDFDGDVDLEDYALWETCLAGPGVPGFGGCEHGDLDGDDDIDLGDFGLFQNVFTGPR
ncbi:MAG: hypothetical protein JSV19_08550 [Phycisphaerales bacterium]|nr:MAG: hypothetical protein JSV19_08550 [Phycisphaerales bacterium]